MTAPLFERPPLLQTAVIALATVLALLALGAVLARWTWVVLAPRVELPAPPAVASSGGLVSALALFGRAAPGRSGPAATGLAIRLLGIVAGTAGHRGYALLQMDASHSLAVREGDEVAPGIRLAEVGSDHIVLERAGTRETLAWPQRPAAPANP